MERASLREMLIPLVPAAVIALALIVAQPDLGQTVSLGIILLALLWYAGLPLRVFLSSLFAVVVSAAILAVSEGYRSDRVMSWLNPGADSQGSGYQARQAQVRAGQRRRLRRRARPGHREVELPAQRAQRLHLRDHRRGAGLRRRRGPAVPVRPVRLYRDADRAPVGRPVPAAAHRHRHHVGARPGVHQRRLRRRAAAGHRAAAAADLGGRNINGDNASDHRRDRERGATRTRGGGRAARRPRRPGQPAAAAAAARAVRRRPAPRRCATGCAPARRSRRPRRQAQTREGQPERKPHTADRPVRRSVHHGGGQRANRAAGQRHQGRRARTLEGQRHG